MTNDQRVWQLDWTVAPGEILAEALEERGMSQSELARRMDRPVKTVNEIVNGKAAITPETALQLQLVIGISARLWNGLETQYREHLAMQRAEQEMEAFVDWAKGFPIPELVRNELIHQNAIKTKGGKVTALLSFFGVSSPSAWERQWLSPAASFRESATFVAMPKAVATWLRWGEIQALGVETSPYKAETFRTALDEARGLTRRDPLLIFDRLKDSFAASGVVLVLTPELRGTHVSGATRWLSSDRALIQLSLRHKSDDQFWFTVFHESSHVLKGKKRAFVDSSEPDDQEISEIELDADNFARDILLPLNVYSDWVANGDFSEESVRAFAAAQGVAPGIVVGRLQRDHYLPQSHLNRLKKRINWAGRS